MNFKLYKIINIKKIKKMACDCDYEFFQKWSRILSLIASAIYIVLGIGRFFGVLSALNPIDYIFNIYMV